ncbi:uncharacterized protein BJ171DRAFT_476481 [Polychytrium aggregatum]|uniref:uncharacterized protein n=1 Tax=Polychytrium aggregatum TaxID=110093 RepID=UPI0022FE35EC|nr:uncharacterized protein BJ171DRAFT_476481 [Polychytrium aggregatum]KAI9202723.1 hypothetical protein BJ171DRAFT_476481 [Polychytrium aggregatum]
MDVPSSAVFLNEWNEALDGILMDLDPSISLLGFENAGNTCYLDSLLFSMFGGTTVFDPLVTSFAEVKDSESAALANLRTSLRMVINRLRAGKLVKVPYVHRLMNCLIAAGWFGDAAKKKYNQEDVSELYLFLMDKLGAPYLPFQQAFFHGAMDDQDDLRIVTSRLLELAMPEPLKESDSSKPYSDAVHLEDLLVDYFFSSQVNVHRHPEVLGDSDEKTRTVDAWRAWRMLPFFSSQNEIGESVTVKEYEFHHRMMLPMVLKRYVNTETSVHRIDRQVLIPTQIPFGNFILPPESNSDRLFERISSYQLSLRSIISHIGTSTRSGHYMCHTHRHEATQAEPPSSEPRPADVWYQFDDLRRVPDAKSNTASPPEMAFERTVKLETVEAVTQMLELTSGTAYFLLYELTQGDINDQKLESDEVAEWSDSQMALHLQGMEYKKTSKKKRACVVM